jgi:F-type H+-transporting ATPase subunit epsilon
VPLQVELVSPERVLFAGEADRVIARAVGTGDFAILPGHAPFLAALETHPVRLMMTDGSEDTIAVHGGFISVADDPSGEGSKVTILSDVAELASQIDSNRARVAKERAEEAIAKGDDDAAEAALRRAHVRLDVAGGLEALA